jgi:hypothetical protein
MTSNRDGEPDKREPPILARLLLEQVLPLETEESVSGDLLEEYRHRILSGPDDLSANLWYVKQAVGFVWRAVWIFTLLTAAAVVLRDIVDTLVPVVPGPHAYQLRSSLTTWSAVAIYLSSGFFTAVKTGKISAGALVALVSHVAGQLIAIAAGVGLFVSVISRDPATLQEFQMTGGWGEAWGVPLMLVPIALLLGLVGGCCGRLVRRPLTGRLA